MIKETTYLDDMTDDSANPDLTEAAKLFSRLSPESQEVILDLLKSLLSEK